MRALTGASTGESSQSGPSLWISLQHEQRCHQGQTGTDHLPPPGLAYICEGLKEQRKGLVTLVLWNNQLTHTGMAFLGMALVSLGAS